MPAQQPKTFVSLDQFKRTLEEHKWSFLADSFADLLKAKRTESALFNTAVSHGLYYVRAYADATTRQLNLIRRDIREEVRKEVEGQLLPRIATGDLEYDTFRERVNNLDWYYEFSDDRGVYRSGMSAMSEIKALVEEKGGLYLTYFRKKEKAVRDSIV